VAGERAEAAGGARGSGARLEILAMEKSDDGDRDGLLRRSASTRSRTGACSASSLQGRQRG